MWDRPSDKLSALAAAQTPLRVLLMTALFLLMTVTMINAAPGLAAAPPAARSLRVAFLPDFDGPLIPDIQATISQALLRGHRVAVLLADSGHLTTCQKLFEASACLVFDAMQRPAEHQNSFFSSTGQFLEELSLDVFAVDSAYREVLRAASERGVPTVQVGHCSADGTQQNHCLYFGGIPPPLPCPTCPNVHNVGGGDALSVIPPLWPLPWETDCVNGLVYVDLPHKFLSTALVALQRLHHQRGVCVVHGGSLVHAASPSAADASHLPRAWNGARLILSSAGNSKLLRAAIHAEAVFIGVQGVPTAGQKQLSAWREADRCQRLSLTNRGGCMRAERNPETLEHMLATWLDNAATYHTRFRAESRLTYLRGGSERAVQVLELVAELGRRSMADSLAAGDFDPFRCTSRSNKYLWMSNLDAIASVGLLLALMAVLLCFVVRWCLLSRSLFGV